MKHLLTALALVLIYPAAAQHSRIKLYIDCQQVNCDLDFIRQQIPVADFVRDRQASDVHVLISTQFAANGGRKYNVRLIGQQQFSSLTDTCSFFTNSAQTPDDIRSMLVNSISKSLVAFLLKSGQAEQVNVTFNAPKNDTAAPVKDKWNYWVISLGGRMNLSGDNNYKETTMNGNFSASRTTDKSNVDFSFYTSASHNSYTFKDSNGKSVLKTNNEYLEVTHSYIKSLNSKWSAAYEAEFRKSSYSNIRGAGTFGVGIEYDIFPYKLSSNKFLVVRYELNGEARTYFQETIFNKTKETLFSHDLGIYARFTQPWGSISSFLTWYNYLHDFSANNLSFYANAELRLFKGLSLNFYGQASMINDQLNLAKGGATAEEVLLRLKALSTSFNYYTGIGLNYRFGSKYNNFVNPRFTNGR